MSFLAPLAAPVGSAIAPTAAASGLGHLIGADPSRVGMIASRIGTAANGVAAAGGAAPGYSGAAPQQVDNHLQLLDPEVLRGIIARFAPQGYTR